MKLLEEGKLIENNCSNNFNIVIIYVEVVYVLIF